MKSICPCLQDLSNKPAVGDNLGIRGTFGEVAWVRCPGPKGQEITLARKFIVHQNSSPEERRKLMVKETVNYKRLACNPAVPKVSATLAPGHNIAASDSFLDYVTVVPVFGWCQLICGLRGVAGMGVACCLRPTYTSSSCDGAFGIWLF